MLILNRKSGEKAMRNPRTPIPGDLLAVCGVLLLAALELVALATAPAGQRHLVTGAVIGSGTAASITTWAVLHTRRRTAQRTHHERPSSGVDASWFTEGTLDGFPMDEIRPFLLGPEPVALNRLYIAWILAVRGHDITRLADHLDLPKDAVRPLAQAAQRQQEPGRPPTPLPRDRPER